VELLINVVLPLSLAIIMLSLGIGLTFGDFRRVLTRFQAFALGAGSQIILLPAVAYIVVRLFGLPGELAVGVMLLSFCPGGVTSNMIAKLAKGDVALSVSLTAVISLLSILSVPFLAAWSVAHFMGSDAPEVSVADLAVKMFLITTLPVLIWITLRRFASPFAIRIEPVLSRVATILFAIIVVAVLAGNWTTFTTNVATLGPALITLNIALLLLGLGVASLSGLVWAEVKTVSIETGIQNATLGIALAAIITGQTSGFFDMALPSAVYGILMYFVAAPFVAWYRRT
jgi:BASS family bile acid:Na+ symporter